MFIRTVLIAVVGLLLFAPAGRARELDPIDYAAYYEVLPLMKEISEASNKSVGDIHTLMTELLGTADDAKAAGIRAQIRPLLVEHRKMKERMVEIVDRVLMKPGRDRSDIEALRALRDTVLRRVSWNNTFFKYVARDISQAIGVPIRLNAKVQELNTVEIGFPEISAEGVLTLICQNFGLKWIVYGGEFVVLKQIGPNEARFLAWEKDHGPVDWIAEDKAKTYEDVAVGTAKRELKKVENMDLPLLKQNMTKIYILEGESSRHEFRLKELEMHARVLDMLKQEARTQEEVDSRIKRHKHILHYLYMERENAIEVWDVINRVLGEQPRLEDENEELRRLLAIEIPLIEWTNVDIEVALQELGRMVGVQVAVDLPVNLEVLINLSVENVTLETVIALICDLSPLDWRFVNGKLFFAHLHSD